MFVKPQGHTLHVLVRVPLTTYTDADYPRRAGDYVDLAQGRSVLARRRHRGAAGKSEIVSKASRQLPNPRIVSARHVAGFGQILRQL